jgi:hypothetical protein
VSNISDPKEIIKKFSHIWEYIGISRIDGYPIFQININDPYFNSYKNYIEIKDLKMMSPCNSSETDAIFTKILSFNPNIFRTKKLERILNIKINI